MTQVMDALERANTTRSIISDFCQELRRLPRAEAYAALADLLESDHPGALSHAPIAKLLRTLRGMGPIGTDQALAEADIRANYRLYEVSPGRRRRLAQLLRYEAGEDMRRRDRELPSLPGLLPAAPLAAWLLANFSSHAEAERRLHISSRTLSRVCIEDSVTLATAEKVLAYAPVALDDLYPELGR